MRSLVIGGGGFIGHNLAELLLAEDGSSISIIDREPTSEFLSNSNLNYFQFDANDTRQLMKCIQQTQPQVIFHLAANSDISKSSVNPEFDAKDTFGTTNSLVNALIMAKYETEVVFSSTSAVYGNKNKGISEQETRVPVSSYGWMKYASEELLLTAQKNKIISRLLIARFPNVTGKYQTHGVVFDLVNKIRNSKTELNVLGNGNQTKPYITASLLCRILNDVLKLRWENQLILNIGPSDTISVKKIVSILKQVTNLEFNEIYGDSESGWFGDIPNYFLDTKLLYQLLPELKIPSSEESITNSISHQWHST